MSYRTRRQQRDSALATERPPSAYRRRPVRPVSHGPMAPFIDRIGNDPLFALTTRSGDRWIDPFTGAGVPLEGDLPTTARAHWKRSASYREGRPLAAAELMVSRWREDLIEQLPHDRRLRLFGPGETGWLNPFSGLFRPDIQRREGLVTQRTVWAMARVLAEELGFGPGRMLTPADLDAILAAREAEAADEALPEILDAAPTLAKPLSEPGTRRTEVQVKRAARVVTPLPDPSARTEPRRARRTAMPLPEAGTTPSSLRSRSESDLRRAADFQNRIMGGLPEIPGYTVGLHFSPYREIGGDCYHFHTRAPNRHWLFLGDAVGHGMQAALIAHSTISALRWLLDGRADGSTLPEVLARLNGVLRRDLAPGQFVTMFAAELDTEAHALHLTLAGHHPALVANATDPCILRRVGSAGAALGLLGDAAFADSLTEERIAVRHGDRIVQYTDGLSEIHGKDGDEGEFGDHRVWASICAGLTEPAQNAADHIARAAMRFGGRAEDDLSILTLDRLATD